MGEAKAAMDYLPEESLLDSRPSLSELTTHVNLVSKWYEIGTRLDLDSDKLEAIHSSPDSASYKTIHMYKLWLDSDPHATWRQLIKVLEDMKPKKGHIRSTGKYNNISEANCLV